MSKYLILIGFIFILLLSILFRSLLGLKLPNSDISEDEEIVKDNTPVALDEKIKKLDNYFLPIDNFTERITKKSFGDYIIPQTSPVQPEKFKGYHTGVDLEIFPGEEDKDVEIFAFCNGNVVEKRKVTGYGGVLIQSCKIKRDSVTVLYGHLKLISIQKEKGEELLKGEIIGVLGKGFSPETDGERKHLHFAIHKGKKIDSRGYVQQKEELKEWIDPLSLLENL